jgi:dienelactone hydrolase
MLSHGYEGNASLLASQVGRTMVGWGAVVIAANYTHSTGVPIGAPGGPNDPAGSRENVLRAHMTYELLRRLGYVDMSRVALHGHSMGAWLNAVAAAKYPSDFRVASTTGGGVRPDRMMRSPGPTSDEVRGIRIPFQLHHGDADQTVPIEWDTRFAEILTDRGVPNELYRYRGGHLAPRSSPEMLERVHAWYARFGMF